MPNDNVHSFDSRCPVVREEIVRACRVIDVTGGLRQFKAVFFEHAIKWLRESETTVVVSNMDGQILQEGSINNDFYGFLTSLSDPVGDFAQAYAQTFGVSHDGWIVVEALTTVTDKPVVEVEDEPCYGVDRRRYRSVPNDWCLNDEAFMDRFLAMSMDERLHDHADRTFLRPVVVADRHVVWSSRTMNDPAAQAERIMALRPVAIAGLPVEAQAQADEVLKRLCAQLVGRQAD